MKSTTVFSAAVLAVSQLFGQAVAFDDLIPDKVVRADNVVRAAPSQTPSATPIPGAPTSHGCYSSGGNLTQVKVENLSSGSCLDACEAKEYYVAGLHGEECLCGFAYPPSDNVAKNSDCSYPCPSYPLEACGGLGSPSYYSIFNTGIQVDVPDYEEKKDDDSDKDKTSSTSAAPTETAAETSSAAATSAAAETTSSAPDDDKSSGSNTAAIAGGVVAGVAVVAAGIGGLFFWMRRKRNAEIEEEHRRNAAVNAFISGAKPPGSSDGISMTDSRLDPVMAHRRLSDGSIADNEDYSRRILRVC